MKEMYQLSIIEINFFEKHSLLAKMSSDASDDDIYIYILAKIIIFE